MTRTYLNSMAIAALACGAMFASQPVWAQSVTGDWAPAARAGTVSCPSKYPAAGNLGSAFLHVWNNTCWSCPKGYKRTIDPNVAGSGACLQPGTTLSSKAAKHNRATGFLKTDCPRGSRQFWHIGDGHCYSCPAGYGRTIHGITAGNACQKTQKAKYAAGVERGNPGCPDGAFQHFLSDSCYRCPVGFARSAHVRLDGKLENLNNACYRRPPPPSDLTAAHNTEVARVQNKYAGLISSAASVAWNLKDHRAEIDAAARTGRPLSPALRESSGLNALSEQAADAGFKTLSIGVAIDASFVVGGTFSAGIAHSVKDWTGVYTYSSNAISFGASIGLDVAPEIGFWNAPPEQVAGNAHGLVIGAAYKGGAALSFWWDYCPDVEGKVCIFHPFLGFVVAPQIGVSAEAEYIRGETRAALFDP